MRILRKGPSARMWTPRSRVSVIIPVMNERTTLPAVLREVKKLRAQLELIIVVNGSTDGSAAIASMSGAKVIHYEQPLGHDVGRSIGARHATGDILLFLDGDMVIPAAKLMPYLHAVERGVDVALNQYNGKVAVTSVHPVVLAKHALNAVLGRPDLKGASMTTIPHALSRRAVETIGVEHLAVPPKAQAIAIQRKLKVAAVHLVQVGRINPVRRREKGSDPLGRLIIGDHLEAIRWYTEATNERGLRTDLFRNRHMVR
ncbi:glycosyltransferase family 2 protein [Paenibacillus rigui]|uniref:Glycosyl transferase family 2 n=1 Tax=Paenibacillus rigui TaxID=554312 RepID=A0A229UJ53_9BACL|nr:glycosyltransferase [Paenibacillus rigui]OXM83487.1 glycosyl transferase family 2 [Paenibacillus rigui]